MDCSRPSLVSPHVETANPQSQPSASCVCLEEAACTEANERDVRRRIDMIPFPYNEARAKAILAGAGSVPDVLKQLYPHKRDAHCWMDEVQHKYFVHGEPYPVSVSGVWSVFFHKFDSDRMAPRCLASARTCGFKNVSGSIFNMLMFFSTVRRLPLQPQNDLLRVSIEDALAASEDWHRSRNKKSPLDLETLQKDVFSMISPHKEVPKPSGKNCYFLAMCAGCTAEDLQTMWSHNGDVESFKGTLLHKQIELFIQSLAHAQSVRGIKRTPLQKSSEKSIGL